MAALRRTTRFFRQLNAFRSLSSLQSQNSARKYTCIFKTPYTHNFPNQQLCICLFSHKTEAVLKNAEPHVNVTSDQTNPETESDSKQSKKGGFRSKFTGKNLWKLGLAVFSVYVGSLGVFLVYFWGAPPLDPEGNPIKDEFSELGSVQQHLRRAWKEMRKQKQLIEEPSREKLLPDPLQYPYIQPPYTLVIEMTGVLVHPDWTYNTGWRFKKRPGIEYFLQAIGPPLFETVVYTSETGMNGDPILNSLDPNGHIMYRLYRDATRYVNGQHVKDLSYLNRDLSKVIFIDWNENAASDLQKSNAFKLKKWKGEDDDRTLIDLAHFLQAIAASKVEDVRTVLDYYSQFEDPIEKFKENQRLLQEEQERQNRFLQEQQQKGGSGYFPGFRGRR